MIVQFLLKILRKFTGQPKRITNNFHLPFSEGIDVVEIEEETARGYLEDEYSLETLHLLAQYPEFLSITTWKDVVQEAYYLHAFKTNGCPLCQDFHLDQGTSFKNSDKKYYLCRLCYPILKNRTSKKLKTTSNANTDTDNSSNDYCLYQGCPSRTGDWYCIEHNYM